MIYAVRLCVLSCYDLHALGEQLPCDSLAVRHRSDSRTGVSGPLPTNRVLVHTILASYAGARSCDLSTFVCLMKLCMRLFIGIVLRVSPQRHARNASRGSARVCVFICVWVRVHFGRVCVILISDRKFLATRIAQMFSQRTHTHSHRHSYCVCVHSSCMRLHTR